MADCQIQGRKSWREICMFSLHSMCQNHHRGRLIWCYKLLRTRASSFFAFPNRHTQDDSPEAHMRHSPKPRPRRICRIKLLRNRHQSIVDQRNTKYKRKESHIQMLCLEVRQGRGQRFTRLPAHSQISDTMRHTTLIEITGRGKHMRKASKHTQTMTVSPY